MKRTEIPAVKVWGFVYPSAKGRDVIKFGYDKTLPKNNARCILRTAAADRLILDVVRAAIDEKNAGDALDANPNGAAEWDTLEMRITALKAAIQKLEKAGVKL